MLHNKSNIDRDVRDFPLLRRIEASDELDKIDRFVLVGWSASSHNIGEATYKGEGVGAPKENITLLI